MDVRKKILLKQIGAKIAYYRTLRDLKQEELATLAHISQSVLSRIESGKYNDTLSVPMLLDIADGLQIDMSLLVSFNEVEKSMWWQSLSRNEEGC
ncbi:MAG: helix-turn-helix transcriptional regulator [Selenomonadaceae bacterium]|nr:helix-turn-helix transcriptional regulator [Selenomonadaceae bacterium]